MRIDAYYRNVARASLNASIVAVFPAMVIIAFNIYIFHNQRIMLLTIPFLIYSMLSFHNYLAKMKRTITIEKHLIQTKKRYHSLFKARHLAVLFMNTTSPQLMIFFPDGYLAAVIKKCSKNKEKTFRKSQVFSLSDLDEELIGFYIIKKNKQLVIEVYDKNYHFLGSFERTKVKQRNKEKKELINAVGRFIGSVEGANYYMDEQIMDPHNRLIGRLRRGLMPMEWSNSLPDPNTPIFSFSTELSEQDKMLQMTILINEFFILR